MDKRRNTTYVGRDGESHAVAYLEAADYTILCRNFYYRKAEIDIIAFKGGFVVIVEVKTRTGRFYEALSESIPRTKVARLVRAAHHFVRREGIEAEVRFDVIQVLLDPVGHRVIHLEDAFYFF